MPLALILAATLTLEQKAAMAPVEAMLAAIAAHDGPAALAATVPGGGATIASEKPDGTRTIRRLSWEQFTQGMKPTADTYTEILPNPIIRLDGDIGMVWGRYTFSINGVVHHCGVDHFGLVRSDGAWKIADISWSSRATGCATATLRSRKTPPSD